MKPIRVDPDAEVTVWLLSTEHYLVAFPSEDELLQFVWESYGDDDPMPERDCDDWDDIAKELEASWGEQRLPLAALKISYPSDSCRNGNSGFALPAQGYSDSRWDYAQAPCGWVARYPHGAWRTVGQPAMDAHNAEFHPVRHEENLFTRSMSKDS